jgi:hypothetical protein
MGSALQTEGIDELRVVLGSDGELEVHVSFQPKKDGES